MDLNAYLAGSGVTWWVVWIVCGFVCALSWLRKAGVAVSGASVDETATALGPSRKAET